MSKLNRLNTVENEEVVNEEVIEVNELDRGPTRKQLAKIEMDFSDVLLEEKESIEDCEELEEQDKMLLTRISKYIDNVRLGNKMTSSEYVVRRRGDDEEEVKELDCDFDSNAGSHLSRLDRMFDD